LLALVLSPQEVTMEKSRLFVTAAFVLAALATGCAQTGTDQESASVGATAPVDSWDPSQPDYHVNSQGRPRTTGSARWN
jgi:hypothetical protein